MIVKSYKVAPDGMVVTLTMADDRKVDLNKPDCPAIHEIDPVQKIYLWLSFLFNRGPRYQVSFTACKGLDPIQFYKVTFSSADEANEFRSSLVKAKEKYDSHVEARHRLIKDSRCPENRVA